jgi:uncharacterized membrane protein YbhN (UPF0104 family)
MQKLANAICWAAVGLLAACAAVVVFFRFAGFLLIFYSLIGKSPLSWWILGPLTISLLLGIASLIQRQAKRRLKRIQVIQR